MFNRDLTEKSASSSSSSSSCSEANSESTEPARRTRSPRKMASGYGIGSGVTAMQRASVIMSRRRARSVNRQTLWKKTLETLSLDLDVLDKAGLKSFEDVLRIPEGELAPLMSAEQVTS